MTSKDEYLKRYLSGGAGERKRKKRPVAKSLKTGFKIVEDDADIPYMPSSTTTEEVEEVISEEEEIMPVVALVNNKTDELKLLGKFQTSNWTSMQQEDNAAATSSRLRHDSDVSSPPRRRRSPSPSDQTPPRRARRRSSADMSPPRRRHDSDVSSPPRNVRSPADQSPPRRTRRLSSNDTSPKRRRHNSDDASPVRRRHDSDNRSSGDLEITKKGKKRTASPDISPPRRRRNSSDSSPIRRHQRDRQSDQSPSRSSRSQLQLSHKRSDPDDESGNNMKAIKRNTRRKEPTEEQKKRKEEMEKKYAVWNKGQKQVQERQEKLAELAAEASKPFARHRGDEDLEDHLKSIEYNDDPMLEYMREKKQKEFGSVSKPKYNGPWPSNRYEIPPGYRWDGIDRSNGFEEKLMSSKNVKKAEEEEYYKWSSGRFE